MSAGLEADLRLDLAAALRQQADALDAGDRDAERRHHYASLRLRGHLDAVREVQRHAVAARGTYAGDRMARLLAPEEAER